MSLLLIGCVLFVSLLCLSCWFCLGCFSAVSAVLCCVLHNQFWRQKKPISPNYDRAGLPNTHKSQDIWLGANWPQSLRGNDLTNATSCYKTNPIDSKADVLA